MNYTALSKEISYALRHAPWEYGLKLDEQGWVELSDMIAAFKKREEYSTLTAKDIVDMIHSSEKKRHEINDNRIRALYGHSTEEKIAKEISRPPDMLYHGTANRFLQSILEQGLISKERQYVHLSADRKTAMEVGKRRDDKPVILAVHAAAAWRDGVPFYHGNETIWLADRIPAQYIELMGDDYFSLQLQQERERSCSNEPRPR